VIRDPAIRSWTLREVAVLTRDTSALTLAADAAREVQDPVQRTLALRATAVASGDQSLFKEALASLEGVTGAPLAYALSDLAVASGDHSLVERIDPAYADARTAALLGLGEQQAAWEAAGGIGDPYDQARAQAAIAAASVNADLSRQIEVPLYRDLALRDVIRKSGDVSLTDSIQSGYYKVQALTALGDTQAAFQLAGGLADSYPLVDLSAALAAADSQAVLSLLEKMDRESDKAVALRAIAVASRDQALFEQAQSMAVAARVRGDALAPAEASLALAEALWTIDPVSAQSALQRGYEVAQRISIK
jgi:hypothetical protein